MKLIWEGDTKRRDATFFEPVVSMSSTLTPPRVDGRGESVATATFDAMLTPNAATMDPGAVSGPRRLAADIDFTAGTVSRFDTAKAGIGFATSLNSGIVSDAGVDSIGPRPATAVTVPCPGFAVWAEMAIPKLMSWVTTGFALITSQTAVAVPLTTGI